MDNGGCWADRRTALLGCGPCQHQVRSICAASGWIVIFPLWLVSSEVKVLSGHSWAVFSLIVMRDGRLVSGSYDKTIKVWHLDLTSPSCLFTLSGHTRPILCLSEGTDGLLLSGWEWSRECDSNAIWISILLLREEIRLFRHLMLVMHSTMLYFMHSSFQILGWNGEVLGHEEAVCPALVLKSWW